MTARGPLLAAPRTPVEVTERQVRERRERRADGMRAAAVAAALVATAFLQQPGRLVPDTKLDLVVNPGRLLAQAWRLWDPLSSSGQLGDQAYGYLFPMGPFFWLGSLARVPMWAVQRAWWSLLLVVAFTGTRRLAERMGIGTPGSRIIAGAAFALAPRIVTELGAISIEAWPTALAPWALLPLVGCPRGRERSAAARSGVAILCAGGVNAIATAALLPLPALWLATRLRRRIRLAAWWVLAVVLATAWWAVPLVVLGRFSPPFLDWIESGAVTSAVASPANALRGTTHWLGYLAFAGGPQWPAGWALVHEPVAVAGSGLLAAAGLAGLCRRGMPHRAVLAAGLGVGLLLLTAGHVGAAAGPLAGQVQHALDGVLAPARNLHKVDALVRLPLALGLAHLLGTVRMPGSRDLPGARLLPAVVAALAVLAGAAPALAGSLPQPGSFDTVPAYWRQTAAWLGAQRADGRALVMPGATTGAYVWGRPRDEPLQPLSTRPWTVRDALPFGSAGGARLLDAIQARLDAGRSSPGFAPLLARSGIRFLVVRNDLAPDASPSTVPVLVQQSLEHSPGLRAVRDFGPILGTPLGSQLFPGDGLDLPRPAVRVWQVDASVRDVETWDAAATARLQGGPESLLPLLDAGLAAARPLVLVGDPVPAALGTPPVVLTDGYRRREVAFGAVGDNASATLSADDPFREPRLVHDYLPVQPAGRQAVVRYGGGLDAVDASSSGSDVSALLARGVEHAPFAAVDGDPQTSWRSGAWGGARGQWLEVRFAPARALDDVRIVVPRGDDVADVAAVDVTTDAGAVHVRLGPQGTATMLRVPVGPTRRLRVTVEAVRARPAEPAAIAELSVAGVTPQRIVVVPPVPRGPTAALALTRPDDWRGDCAFAAERPLCAAGLGRSGEEQELRREVTVPAGASLSGGLSATAVARQAAATQALLDPAGPVLRAQASSQFAPDLAVRPAAAVDGLAWTGWVAGQDDRAPTLTLTWPTPAVVARVELASDVALAASRPLVVDVSSPGHPAQRSVADASGVLSLRRPVRTTRLTLRFVRNEPRVGTPLGGFPRTLPVGVSEVRIPGVRAVPFDLDRRVAVRCGSAPSVVIDGRPVRMSAVGTARDVLQSRPLRLVSCGSSRVTLAPGRHDVVVVPTPQLVPESVVLRSATLGASPPAEPVRVRSWGAEHRVVAVPSSAGPRVLVVHENFNAGWHATLRGARLPAVRIDGWQQAFVVPASGGVVTLDYAPAVPYRAGLLGGGGLAVLLLLLAVGGRRGTPGPEPFWRPAWPVLLVSTGAGILAFGWAGVAAVALALAVAAVRRPEWSSALAGGCVLAASLLVAVRPWPHPTSLELPAQLLTLTAIAVVAGSGAGSGARSRPRHARDFRRRNGFSTSS